MMLNTRQNKPIKERDTYLPLDHVHLYLYGENMYVRGCTQRVKGDCPPLMTLWNALTSEYEMRPPGDKVQSVGNLSMTASESL